MTRPHRLTALAALLLLAGCQGAFDVTIVEGKDTVEDFEVDIRPRGEPDARPRYDSVHLLEGAGSKVLWHLRAEPFGTQASQPRLRYGDTPEGFEAVVPAPALEPGRRYALVVSGRERGQLRFEVTADGKIRRLD